jgi:hypothetical protein
MLGRSPIGDAVVNPAAARRAADLPSAPERVARRIG